MAKMLMKISVAIERYDYLLQNLKKQLDMLCASYPNVAASLNTSAPSSFDSLNPELSVPNVRCALEMRGNGIKHFAV